jgi:hypothetical protein
MIDERSVQHMSDTDLESKAYSAEQNETLRR